MSDGGRRVQLYRLDPSTCAVTDSRTAAVDPYDPEDLARGPDGSLWVADTGDNKQRRDSVAVIVLPQRGEAQVRRLTYPDGPHDAEALLVDQRGRPLVITKEVGRPAGVYGTAQPPEGVGPTPLVRVGELALPPSTTEGGPVGGVGSRLVTGAAESADGSVVAVRSYTDAWLYPVRDGDLVDALKGAPLQVPLPDEPQGEAVAFEPDGTLLSGSETRVVPGELRAVPGAAALVAGRLPPDHAPPTSTEVDRPTPAWLPGVVGGGVAVGALLLVAAALAVRRR
jgi:streptogramin lyase